MEVVEKTMFLLVLCQTFWLFIIFAVVSIKIIVSIDIISNLVLLLIDCFFPVSESLSSSYFKCSSYFNFLQLVAYTHL